MIELALLRSPTYPDPDADTGGQVMTYSLCPHDAHLARSDVFEQSTALNHPPLVVAGVSGIVSSPLRVREGPAEISVLKRGDVDADLLERPLGKAFDVVDGSITLSWAPFEIRTFRLVASSS